MKHLKISDREIYPALWITVAALVLGYHIWRYVLREPALPACVFYTRWHIYCPTCGGTRAVLALLHGNLLQSFYYHPIVPITVVFVGIYLVSQTIWRFRGKHGRVMRYSDRWLHGFVILLLLHCLVRNLLWFGFQIPI